MRDRKSTRLNSSHTVIYTLSLHDALPISRNLLLTHLGHLAGRGVRTVFLEVEENNQPARRLYERSEEHTSELQSHSDLHSFPTRRSSDLPQSAADASRSSRRPRRAHRIPRGRGKQSAGATAL